ncbi:hypothetical protein [Peribacillus butanolivorans]
MDMVLKVCISDGSEIIVDGFDEISFYNELPNIDVSHSGYSWQRESYNELLNNLIIYNFISIKRHDSKDRLEYRNHTFAFKNSNFQGNVPLTLQTKSVTTIIDMYN